jgi:hypothetical protein
MHDLFSEERLSLNQLAKEERVNPSTTWRWYLSGCRGVKLETYVSGGRRYTTREAFRRFQERCTAAAAGGQSAPKVQTPAQRQREIERAERELAEMGV